MGKNYQCPGCRVEFNAEDIAGKGSCPVCGSPFDSIERQKASLHSRTAISWGLVGIGFIVWLFYRLVYPEPVVQPPPKVPTAQEQYASIRKEEKNKAVANTSVIALWDKKKHPYALVLDLYITNSSDKPLKDPVLSCAIEAASGTVIGSKINTIYQVIPPKTEKYMVINFGLANSQGEHISCHCVDASPAD